MPNFKRYYIPNSIVFITTVTRDRIPYFANEENIRLFWETLKRVKELHPFRLLAYVILPDHFHWLMHVDAQDGNFSAILHSVKRNYTLNFKKARGIETALSLWQNRFWDHVIRDEHDLNLHFDYIHWNPVKHGYVQSPQEWRHSTFMHWQERGYYELSWGRDSEPRNIQKMECG